MSASAGSFHTRALSLGARTGLTRNGFGAEVVASRQQTDGYRDHSDHEGSSVHATAAWVGARTLARVTSLSGVSRNGMAYLPAEAGLVAATPRANPLGSDERDAFRQQVLVGTLTRVLEPADGAGRGERTLSVSAMRNVLARTYGVRLDSATLGRFGVAGHWTQASAVLHAPVATLALDVGLWGSSYARAHTLDLDPGQRAYRNVGRRPEGALWGKASHPVGRATVGVDVQARATAFQYRPDSIGGPQPSRHADLVERTDRWTFVNPRAWGSLPLGAAHTLSLSGGRVSREPTRTDLFAGYDNLDAAGAVEVAAAAVRPERAVDAELTLRSRLGVDGARGEWTATGYVMHVTDEIAPLGPLSLVGLPLRTNLPRTHRTGLDLSGVVRPDAHVELGGTLSLLHARIARFTDAATGAVFTNTPPLLTPPVVANARLRVTPGAAAGPAVELRAHHQAASRLTNTGARALSLGAFTAADVTLGLPVRAPGVPPAATRLEVTVRNATNARAATGGYAIGATRYVFPLAGRHVLFTVAVPIR